MSGDVCVHFRTYSSPLLLFFAQLTHYFLIVIISFLCLLLCLPCLPSSVLCASFTHVPLFPVSLIAHQWTRSPCFQSRLNNSPLLPTAKMGGRGEGIDVTKVNNLKQSFDVLLTVHLSIILVTDQLNAQILVLQ